jgi:hypothetical protein
LISVRSAKPKRKQAEQDAEDRIYLVIPSEARNLSAVKIQKEKETFLASLGMTKVWTTFSASCSACLVLNFVVMSTGQKKTG